MSDPTSSTMDNHPLDDLAAYALAALDDAGREAIDDHLAHCPACRDELAGHQETLAHLTTDEGAPPAAVWQRIAAGIGAPGLADLDTAGPARSSPAPPPPSMPGPTDPTDPSPTSSAATSPTAEAPPPPADASASTHPAEEAGHDAADVGAGRLADEAPPAVHDPTSAGRPDALPTPGEGDPPDAHEAGGTMTPLAEARRRRGWTWRPSPLGWLAAAACLAVATATGGFVGFALGNADDDPDLGALAEQAAEHPGAVLGTLADTGGQPVARVVADEDGAYLLLQGLQDLPEGQAYQLWSLSGPQPVSLGMLGRDGTNTVAFRLPPTIDELAISVEPTRGQVAPTTQFRAVGDITPRT